MSDLSWAALIGAGSAVLSSVLTNWFNARSTARQPAHSEHQSQVQWQRSEATRKENQAREEAQRNQQRQRRLLREFWGHILTSEAAMIKWGLWVEGGRKGSPPDSSIEAMPSRPALHGYSVALLELPQVYLQARDYFRATCQFEGALHGDDAAFESAHENWDLAFIHLEQQIGELTGATETVREALVKNHAK